MRAVPKDPSAAREGPRPGIAERVKVEIVPDGKAWTITENGTPAVGVYATREAAFEAVCFSASHALKVGLEISILVLSPYSTTDQENAGATDPFG